MNSKRRCQLKASSIVFDTRKTNFKNKVYQCKADWTNWFLAKNWCHCRMVMQTKVSDNFSVGSWEWQLFVYFDLLRASWAAQEQSGLAWQMHINGAAPWLSWERAGLAEVWAELRQFGGRAETMLRFKPPECTSFLHVSGIFPELWSHVI